MTQVTVLDYDTGNLRSIVQALQRCEAEVLLTGDPIDVARAGHLVIPGVGAFGACMNRLHSRRLVAPAPRVARPSPRWDAVHGSWASASACSFYWKKARSSGGMKGSA